MVRKKLWLAGLSFIMACIPIFTGCDNALVGVLTGFKKAPDPTIKEGKFDFSITYEVDGEVTTISSVYVCEFAESDWLLDGWYIDWDEYIEDRELANRLEETRGYLLLKKTADGEIYLDLNLSARYFMEDPRFDGNANTDEPMALSPRLFIEYNEAKYDEIGEAYSEDADILETYGVKIIDYEYDMPIDNEYKNL